MSAQRTKGILGTILRSRGTTRKLVAPLTALTLALPPPAFPQQIVPDGKTGTTLTIRDNVTDVTTSTIRGSNAFNSFSKFDVYQGNVVNLHVPGAALNLLNLVHGQASSIDGILNAYKNGRIGGNVFFANPYGFLVGAPGVINVGALTVMTPTRAFMDSFFLAPGVPSEVSASMILNGTAPIDRDGLISIRGRINASGNIRLNGGNVINSGSITTNAASPGNEPEFSALVNTEGLQSGGVIVAENGSIRILSAGDFVNSGSIASDGAENLSGGKIDISAEGNIDLAKGTLISAKGLGANSKGGTVRVVAGLDADFREGASIDVRGGASGDGGFVELSAKNEVRLAGGEFLAKASQGRNGSILIDPATITASTSGRITDGASITFAANDSITVESGVVISTRDVAAGTAESALETAPSEGPSGDLTLEAPSISLKSGSKLLAQGDSGFAGGTVALKATSRATTDIMGYREATSAIEVGDAGGGATIRGETVELTAATEVDTKYIYSDASFIDNTVNLATTVLEDAAAFFLGLTGVKGVHSQAVGNARVTVKGGSLIEGAQGVSLRAENTTNAGITTMQGLDLEGPGTKLKVPLGIGALYARNNSEADVSIESGATIKARDLNVRAHNNATLEASIAAGDPGEEQGSVSVAFGYASSDIKANASVAAGAHLNVTGNLSVAATNLSALGNEVEAESADNGRAAAAIAVSDFKTGATATLDADVKDATRVEVIAINENTSNLTSASSKVGTTLNDMIKEGINQKIGPAAAEDWFWKKLGLKDKTPDEKVSPKSTSFRIGGAIAYATSVAEATASVGPGATVHASEQALVAARTKAKDIQIVAESAAISQAKDRAAADTARNTYSAGVAIGNYRHDAFATIGANATLTAPQIGVSADVLIPVRESILTGSTFDRWDNLSTLKDWYGSLSNAFAIFNGASAAKSNSDNSDGSIAMSGSASLLNFSSTARTLIDTDARLNLSGTQSGAWSSQFETLPDDASTTDTNEQVLHEWKFAAPAHVRAARDITLLFHGGNFAPSGAGGGSSSKGLGIAYTQEGISGASETIVREGVEIQGVDEGASAPDADGLRTWTPSATRATDGIQVTAQGKDLIVSIASAGGYGATFGLNGSASVVAVDNRTHALVDDEASLKADTIKVLAEEAPVAWSIAGSFNLSESGGVGIGIGYNGLSADTRAEIADNDRVSVDGNPRDSQTEVTTAEIAARDLRVEARTGGRVEAIAVTGAVANASDDKPGFFGKIKAKYDAVQSKLSGLADIKPEAAKPQSGAGSQGTGSKPTFGLAGAGSAAVNDVEQTTSARVEGVTIDQNAGTDAASLAVRGVADTDIVTASGAAALTRARNSSQKGSAGITGSVSVNLIGNTVESVLRDATVTNANDVEVQALAGGEQLSIAIGAAIDASSAQSKEKSLSATGSLSLSWVDNTVSATIDHGAITGEATATGRDAHVTAYNRTFIGTGGGTLSVGAKTGAGGAITYSDIENAVTASILGGSTVSQFDAVGVRAYNATEIGAGAAHGQVSNATNGNALGGAVVITEITNNTTASIEGLSGVTATDLVEVLAKDRDADAALEELMEPGAERENTVAGLDYCGRDAGGTGVTPAGSCITSVAGVVQLGRGNNIGLSFNWSDIRNNLTARVQDSSVAVTADASQLGIAAESNATITSFAVGVGASDKASGAGSVAVSRIDNAIRAEATAPANNDAFKTLTADTVSIGAKDLSRIDTLGGQINVGKSAAVGAAITYAEIGNETRAVVDQAAIGARTTAALTAENDSRIRSLAVAGTLAVGSGAPAVSASIAANFIGNTTESTIDGASFDDPLDGANTNSVRVRAADKSEIQALAGSVAVGTKAGVGGAFAYSKIGNSVLASIGDSSVVRAGLLEVNASETSKIKSLSVAASGGQTLAISGSVSINHIGTYGDGTDPDEDGNVTTAEIRGSTVSGPATQASVKAQDTSTIESLAGNLSISLGAAAIGGAVADNAIRNLAKASISDSSFHDSASLTVEGRNDSTIKSLSAAGSGAGNTAFGGSASSNRTTNRTISEITNSEITGSSADVSVSALDTATIKSLAGAVAAAGNAGIGAAIAVNRIGNLTSARVTGVRPATDGLDVANLVLRGDSAETIETISAAGGVGGTVGVAGSLAVNRIDSVTEAYISDGAAVESDQNVGVIAESDDRISTGAGALGVGISAVGAGASVVVNQIGGATRAYVAGPGTRVAARAGAGTTALKVASGTLKSDVDLSDGVDRQIDSANPFVRPDLVALRVEEDASGVVVNASGTHHVESFVVNVGVGTVGLSGVANVNVIGGETLAYIDGAQINQGDNSGATAAQSVHVKASDHAYGSNFVGSISGGVVGLGLVGDVHLFDRDTRAYVADATITSAGKTDVGATSSQGMSTMVVGASGGVVGLVGAGTVAKFTSDTEAYMASTNATVGSQDVKARHTTRMYLSGGTASGGGVGVGATFDVGLDNSNTRAHIDGSTLTTAGRVSVDADSSTEVKEWTVAGSGAGAAAVAGTAAVAVIGNTTQAYVTGTSVGSAGARAAGLSVIAEDAVVVSQIAGSAAIAGVAGAGVAAGVTKLENTTSAYLNNVDAFTSAGVTVEATATRDLSNTVATAGGGIAAGIGGSVGVTLVGKALADTQDGDTNANRELNNGGSGTLAQVDSFSGADSLGVGSNLSSRSDNGYAGAGLSDAEIAELNGRTRLTPSASVYSTANRSETGESFDPATQLSAKTAAVIGGSSMIDAGGDVKVHASEKDTISVVTGGGAIGGLAGIGGSVSVAEVTNNVEAAILGTTQTRSGAGRIEVIAEAGKLGSDRAVTAKAYQAAGGAVALGAAIAVGDVTNNVKATIGRGTTTEVVNGAGNLTVRADDNTDVESEASGASLGLVAAGAVIARSDKSGDTIARIGNTDAAAASPDTFAAVDSGTLQVQAGRSGNVKSTTTAGAGGIISGSGADAKATDAGAVHAFIGNSVQADGTGGGVAVDASATPETEAVASGINVSAAAAIGASLAGASADVRVRSFIGSGSTITAGTLTLSAAQNLPGSGLSASAGASGTSGALLAGINATSAQAVNTGRAESDVGEDSTLTVNGTATISAVNRSAQKADASGIAVGIVAAGANIAKATSDTVTRATLGDRVSVSGTSLMLRATGTDNNLATATAGSGGVVSGSAAEAVTSALSDTRAETGSGDDAHPISVDTLEVDASHTTQFNGAVDSTNASLVGASGATAEHTVNSTVHAGIGETGRVTANNVIVKAENRSHKFWLGADSAAADALMKADNAAWNINSGSGGLVGMPAGSSDSHITQVTTAAVGADARVHVLMPTEGDGTFDMDATNVVIARDKAKLDSGGAVALAKAVSHIFVDRADASVVFGERSEVVSDLGDINAGARSDVRLDTHASADTYGLAGAPAGEAYSVYRGLNAARVDANALIRADDGNVNLAGGQSSIGEPTSIVANSNVNVWNKTAIPISTQPDAQSNILNDARVSLAASSNVEAAADISLSADKGTVSAAARGIGKDIYREALAAIASGISSLFGGGKVSFDVHGGSTSVDGTASVAVDGTALAGIHRNESLTLDYELLTTPTCSVPPCIENGRVKWRLLHTATDGVRFTVDPAVGLAANIQERINKLRSLMSQYSTDPVAVAAYDSEIRFLEHKLAALGLAGRNADGSINVGKWNNPSPRQAGADNIVSNQSTVLDYVKKVSDSATTLKSTTANALATETMIGDNVEGIVTNHDLAKANNDTITEKLKLLANFDEDNADYLSLTGKLSENLTLKGDIGRLKEDNAADQASVGSKNAQIDTLLGEVDARRSRINAIVTDLADSGDVDGGSRIVALQAEIDARQTKINTLSGEIKNLLDGISERNTRINTRSETLAENNSTVDSLQSSLATAFSDGSDGNKATVAVIEGLRTGNSTHYGTIDDLTGSIATGRTNFSDSVTTVATDTLTIASNLNHQDRTVASAEVSSWATQLPTLSDTPANGPVADFVHVDDINVRLGNIRVKADDLSGTGALRAPGDAQINITNNTPDFLVVKNLSIASDEGGTLRLNGVLVNDPAGINRVNRSGSGADSLTITTRDTSGAPKPAITILSNYDPEGAAYAKLPAPAPNIELDGDITNLRGSVTVKSKAGSILSNGVIRAGTVDVQAENGDFVQSYVNGFYPVGGDPASIEDHGTPLGTGIIANGSVFISARYLNINSLIQSGIEQWALDIPQTPVLTGTAKLYGLDQARLDAAVAGYGNGTGPRFTDFVTAAGTVRFDAQLKRLEADTDYALNDMSTPDWATRTANFNGLYPLLSDYGNIGASYDPATDRYVLDGETVKGGYIQLFGQIINTTDPAGASGPVGKLRVLDGYGQIRVTNPSGRAVVVNRLDAGADPTGTGRGTAGIIDITDIQAIEPQFLADGVTPNPNANQQHVVHSVYTRNRGTGSDVAQVMLKRETATFLPDGSLSIQAMTADVDALATDGRNTHYDPQEGLRYVWTTGTDNSTVTYLHYKGSQWFGSSDLRGAPTGTIVSQSGPFVLKSYRLDDGTYLVKDLAHADTRKLEPPAVTKSDGNPTYVKTREWSECNWWTLCIAGSYHYNVTQTTPFKTVTTKSLKADYPIAIEFSGWDQGTVTVNSAADVILNGEIRNNAGTTTITAGSGTAAFPGVATANRSIIQGSDTALITSKDINLAATGSVGGALGGAPEQPIQIALGGVLNAAAGNGNVRVAQTIGDLKLGTVVAAGSSPLGTGRVVLNADGDIVAASPASLVQADRIELTSRNGAIGSIAAPLAIDVGTSSDMELRPFYGLKASAAGDIGITARSWAGNPGGDLLVDRVSSLGGDVSLGATGRIIDNNPLEEIDQRTWDELKNFWNSLGLIEDTDANRRKQQQAILSYESGKTQDYQLYWRLRERQADPSTFDPNFRYVANATERSALSSQYEAQVRAENPELTDTMVAVEVDKRIASFESNRTRQYRQLDGEVGSLNGGRYSQAYVYQASEPEKAKILDGSSWTERELGISVTPGLLKDITNTNPIVKQPNVQGRTVTLLAGRGVGETQPALTIPTSIDPGSLTDAMKVALAAAERSDISSTDTTIDVVQRKPVNFEALNGLSAVVEAPALAGGDDGSAYLASLGDARLDRIAAQGEARVKVRGSIVNAGPTSRIETGDLVLEAAYGGIGSIPDGPLLVSPTTGAGLTARAENDIWIEATQDIEVDTVFSRYNIRLGAVGSILDFHNETLSSPDNNLRGRNIALTSQSGSIGSLVNPLDAGIDPNGSITATASSFGQGVYLNGPTGEIFNIGSVSSGDAVVLSAASGMKIGGSVTGPGPISLFSGDIVHLDGTGSLRSTVGPIMLSGDGVKTAEGSYVEGDNGTISVFAGKQGADLSGRLTAANGFSATSTSGEVTLSGTGLIQSTNGPVALSGTGVTTASGSEAEAGSGNISLIAGARGADLNGSLAAGGSTVITSEADLDVDGTITSQGAVDLASEGSMILGPSCAVRSAESSVALAGTTLGMKSGSTVAASGGPISVRTTSGDAVLTALSSSGDISVASAGSVYDANGGLAPSSINLAGRNVTLVAAHGAMGTPDARIVVDSSGQFNASGYGDMHIKEFAGNLGADSMLSQTGSVDLVVADGSATIGQVSAPGTVSIQANGPFIKVRLADPAVLDLRDPFPGALISVDRAEVAESVTAWSDSVRLGDIVHTGHGTLRFDVRGGSGPVAGLVEIGARSSSAVDFDRLYAEKATINADVDRLSFLDTRIGSRGDLFNSRYHVVVDNRNRTVQPSHLQLYAPDPFFLELFPEQRFRTNALVVNFDPRFIVNEFSTENSAVGLTQKMLWIGKREDRLYYNPMDPAPHPWQRGITPSGREVIDVKPGSVSVGEGDVQLRMDNVDVIFQEGGRR